MWYPGESCTHLVLSTSTEEGPFLEPGDNGLRVPKSSASHGNTSTFLGLNVLGGCFCKGGGGCKEHQQSERRAPSTCAELCSIARTKEQKQGAETSTRRDRSREEGG